MGGLRGTSGAPSSEDARVSSLFFSLHVTVFYLFIIYSLYLTSCAVATFSAGTGRREREGGRGRKKFNPVLYFYHVNNDKIIITKIVTIKKREEEKKKKRKNILIPFAC